MSPSHWTEPFRAMQPFRDRIDAGQRLAAACARWRGRNPLVLGIPRGGVPVAAEVARALGGDLDIVVAHKVGAPGQPELALAAVTADGHVWVDEQGIGLLGVPRAWLDAEAARKILEARERERWMREELPQQRVAGRTVLVVDDGLATGATMHAAVEQVRAQDAAAVIVAAPVGSMQACAALASSADEVVCPWEPPEFRAVSLYYTDFRPTTDDDVRRILRQLAAEHAGQTAARESAEGA